MIQILPARGEDLGAMFPDVSYMRPHEQGS